MQRLIEYFQTVWRDPDWTRVTNAAFFGVSIFLLFIAWFADADYHRVPFLDGTNLLFHEAGHPLFGLFSSRFTAYGGTLGQLLIPMLAMLHFWWRRETTGVALTLIWFFENGLHIACYMADARAQVLPLVGGGEHDWTYIFSNWDVLEHDTTIAGIVHFFSWVGMLSVFGLFTLRWLRDKRMRSGSQRKTSRYAEVLSRKQRTKLEE